MGGTSHHIARTKIVVPDQPSAMLALYHLHVQSSGYAPNDRFLGWNVPAKWRLQQTTEPDVPPILGTGVFPYELYTNF